MGFSYCIPELTEKAFHLCAVLKPSMKNYRKVKNDRNYGVFIIPARL